MGNPYNHKYHVAPSNIRYGEMKCSRSGKTIDPAVDDFVYYERSKSYNVHGYVVLRCHYHNDEQFLKIERCIKAEEAKRERWESDVSDLAKKHNHALDIDFVSAVDDAVGIDLSQWAFDSYGSC